jgi:hypothetical protein
MTAEATSLDGNKDIGKLLMREKKYRVKRLNDGMGSNSFYIWDVFDNQVRYLTPMTTCFAFFTSGKIRLHFNSLSQIRLLGTA